MDLLFECLGLIQDKDWERFQLVALSNPCIYEMLSVLVSQCEEFNGMTLLHAVVRHDPPIDILKQMVKLYPEALKSKDCIGRTSLHVAAGSGVSSEVIKLLVSSSPQACRVQDEDLRTPLHFACDSSCRLFDDDDEANPRGPPSYEVVLALLAGSQSSVTLEDIDEMTALEYAIVSDAPIKVVQLLQKVLQKQQKKRAESPRDLSPSNIMELQIKA